VSTDDGTSAVGNDAQILSTRFQLVNSDATRRVYHRTIAEPDGLNGPQYHVAEIVEQKYDSRHEEIQAFVRGEIDVMPHLQPWEVDAFKASGLAFVQQYALPRNDVIVFNPMSESVRSTQLRRALSLSINRDAILKNIILKDDSAKYGRVSSSAWHTQSYASNPLVEDPVYDVKLAFALKFAAEEQLKIPDKLKFIAEAKARAIENKEEFDEEVFRRDHADEIKAAVAHITLPKLRMVCVPDESAIAAAEKMISVWSKIGLDVELIPADRAGDPMGDADWDFMYRRVSMKEPLLELWPLMTTDNSFDIDRLSAYPDWMRQELINLDYATSFLDAQDKLFTIHRHIAAQAFLIPLWEVDDFAAYQRNISGFSEEPLTTYHNVERWAVKP
jgi:ABC-type transport system substrate-binding protein